MPISSLPNTRICPSSISFGDNRYWVLIFVWPYNYSSQLSCAVCYDYNSCFLPSRLILGFSFYLLSLYTREYMIANLLPNSPTDLKISSHYVQTSQLLCQLFSWAFASPLFLVGSLFPGSHGFLFLLSLPHFGELHHSVAPCESWKPSHRSVWLIEFQVGEPFPTDLWRYRSVVF